MEAVCKLWTIALDLVWRVRAILLPSFANRELPTKRIGTLRTVKFTLSIVALVLPLGGCGTLSNAYQSVATALSKTFGGSQQPAKENQPRDADSTVVTMSGPATPTPPADNAVRQVDVAKYRTWKPSERARTVAYAVQQAAFSGSDSAMKALADYLTKDVSDPFIAIKNLHDWIALYTSYDVKAFFAGVIPSQEPTAVLQRHTAVCAGYAALFKRLATLAGIEALTIGGYGRGCGYNSIQTEELKANHDWNAVKVDGAWYLLDATWDSGYLDGSRFVGEYSNDYFLLPADKMIYTHMPTDHVWQLLEHPLSASQCLALPYLRGEFFRYPFENYVNLKSSYACESELAITLFQPGAIGIDAQLYDTSGAHAANASLVQTGKGSTEISVRPPRPGDWLLRVFAGSKTEQRMQCVWETGVHSTSGNDEGYPLTFSTFQQLGCRLDSPFEGRLRVRQKCHFKLTVPGVIELLLNNGGDRTTVRAVSPGEFEFDYTPMGAGQLNVSELAPRSSTYWTILRYEVRH